MPALRVAGFAGCVLALVVGPLDAQRPQVRRGFWIGLGAGSGTASVSCDSCGARGRETALGYYIKLGGTLSPRLLLGGEIDGWLKTESLARYAGNGAVVLYFYPAPTSGVFVKGGAGLAVRFVETLYTGTHDGSGLGITAGAGYDWRIGRNVSLTPMATYYYGDIGALSTVSGTSTGWKQNVFEFTLGVTFH